MKLSDFPIVDFSGGVVRNKSDYVMSRNEVKHALNVEFDEYGRVKRRRGFYTFGSSVSGTPDNVIFFSNTGSTGNIIPRAFIVSRATGSAQIQVLASTILTSPLRTTETTASTQSTADLPASGAVEINGDTIEYTGKTSTSLTGVSGVRVDHPTGSVVNRWLTGNTLSMVNSGDGAYMAVMQASSSGSAAINYCIIAGRDGANYTAHGGSSGIYEITGDQDGLFHTIYRDRVYSVGSGILNGTNSYPNRVAYSNAGNFQTWTSTDFFDVDDTEGEIISGVRPLNDVLWIFKPNSIYSWNEDELKQRVKGAGAYHHRTIQEIDGIMYFFGPGGIFASTGYQAAKISDPVDEYLQDFAVTYNNVDIDVATFRVTNATFSGVWGKKYLLYIGDIRRPINRQVGTASVPIGSRTITEDVVLVYDTIKKNWTVWNGFTNFTFFASESNLWTVGSLNQKSPQIKNFLLGGAPNNLYRLFENTITDIAGTFRGGDVWPDAIADNAGLAVEALLETPLYDINTPQITKKFGRIFVMVEQGDWDVFFKVEKKDQFVKREGYESDWLLLGKVNSKNGTLNFPLSTEGNRIALRFHNFQKDGPAVLNGFIIRDIETIGN